MRTLEAAAGFAPASLYSSLPVAHTGIPLMRRLTHLGELREQHVQRLITRTEETTPAASVFAAARCGRQAEQLKRFKLARTWIFVTRTDDMGKMWLGENNGCWLRVWDRAGFAGHSVMLWGPADFPSIRIAQQTWRPQIMSIAVGPNAYVQFYEDLNFEQSVLWLAPKQRIENVEALECGDEIDSLRIFDRPPFAREPGYAAYLRAVTEAENNVAVSENDLPREPIQRARLRIFEG